MTNKNNFHRKMSSEQVGTSPFVLVLTLQ